MGDIANTKARAHPLFAASYDFLTRGTERWLLGPIRSTLVGEAAGRVLEVGAGTGANFPYYQHADRIVVTEPDPFMLRRARIRAAELGLEIEFHDAPAEALPFTDSSFDTVVLTLVLCTVVDQAESLSEIRRVPVFRTRAGRRRSSCAIAGPTRACLALRRSRLSSKPTD